MRKTLSLLLSLAPSSLRITAPRLRPAQWAWPVVSPGLKNWYKLDEKLFRSAQPDRKGFEALKQFGISNILNLRDYHTDRRKSRDHGVILYEVDMMADEISAEAVILALKIIRDAQGPVLVHCWHGADRTGTICAMYRMVFQGWTKDDALDELIHGGYGFHDIFPNILEFIRSVDIGRVRRELGFAIPVV